MVRKSNVPQLIGLDPISTELKDELQHWLSYILGLVADLPPEVLEVIFSQLDDVSLYAVGNTCKRWQRVLRGMKAPEQWQVREFVFN